MLDTLTNAQMAQLHNAVAATPVKKFASAEKAMQRTTAAIDEAGLTVEQAMVKAGLIEAKKPTVDAGSSQGTKVAQDRVVHDLDGYYIVVNGRAYGTWKTKSAASAAMQVEQERVTVRRSAAGNGSPGKRGPSGKGMLIIELCSREQGATTKDLLEATGWPSIAAKTTCAKLAERVGMKFDYIARTPQQPTIYKMVAAN